MRDYIDLMEAKRMADELSDDPEYDLHSHPAFQECVKVLNKMMLLPADDDEEQNFHARNLQNLGLQVQIDLGIEAKTVVQAAADYILKLSNEVQIAAA